MEVGSESKGEVCDDVPVSGLADGSALVRMCYVMLQQQTNSKSQWLNTTKIYFSFLLYMYHILLEELPLTIFHEEPV